MYRDIVHTLLYGAARRSPRLAARARREHPVDGCALDEDDECDSGWSDPLFGCVEPPMESVEVNGLCLARRSWQKLWVQKAIEGNEAWLAHPKNPYTNAEFAADQIEAIFQGEDPRAWVERHPQLRAEMTETLSEGNQFANEWQAQQDATFAASLDALSEEDRRVYEMDDDLADVDDLPFVNIYNSSAEGLDARRREPDPWASVLEQILRACQRMASRLSQFLNRDLFVTVQFNSHGFGVEVFLDDISYEVGDVRVFAGNVTDATTYNEIGGVIDESRLQQLREVLEIIKDVADNRRFTELAHVDHPAVASFVSADGIEATYSITNEVEVEVDDEVEVEEITDDEA